MKKTVPILFLFCGFTGGLTGCQHLPNPFVSTPVPSPMVAAPAEIRAEIPAEIAVSPPRVLPVSAAVTADESQVAGLRADNARLKNELAGVLRENARLKKDLAAAVDDNSLLKDLAEKKQR